MGLYETRWKDNGNLITDDGHLLFYSGETKYHRNGVIDRFHGVMIHKDIKYTVMEFTPISSRILTIRIHTKPLNIDIVHRLYYIHKYYIYIYILLLLLLFLFGGVLSSHPGT